MNSGLETEGIRNLKDAVLKINENYQSGKALEALTSLKATHTKYRLKNEEMQKQLAEVKGTYIAKKSARDKAVEELHSLGINLNEFIEAPTYEAATFTPERTKEDSPKAGSGATKTSERDDDDFQNSPSSKSKEDALPVVDVGGVPINNPAKNGTGREYIRVTQEATKLQRFLNIKERKERKATIKQNQNIYKLFRFPTFDDLLNKCRELHEKTTTQKENLVGELAEFNGNSEELTRLQNKYIRTIDRLEDQLHAKS